MIGKYYYVSSVLSIRSTVPQPVKIRNFTFLYNGEIYNGEESDTEFISKIIDISSDISSENALNDDISIDFLNRIPSVNSK